MKNSEYKCRTSEPVFTLTQKKAAVLPKSSLLEEQRVRDLLGVPDNSFPRIWCRKNGYGHNNGVLITVRRRPHNTKT